MKFLYILPLICIPSLSFAYETTVTRIVDGDTVVATIDNKQEKIRIIGINTPESVDPRRPVECFGKEATKQATKLLLNKRITLEDYHERDKHGRILGYISLPDNTDFGAHMIESGYAYSFKSYAHDRRASYNTLEKTARSQQQGLWAPDACLNDDATQDILREERVTFIKELIAIFKALLDLFL